jgi:predicted ArsR family transcriptional regulator
MTPEGPKAAAYPRCNSGAVALADLQRRMLALIAESVKPSADDLAERLFVSRAEASAALAALTEDGLVIHVVLLGIPDFPHPGWLEVTARGRLVLEGRLTF